MQLKGFCTAEETIDQTKRQWEKMFASHIPDLGLVDTLPPPQGAPSTWGEKAASLHLSTPSSLPPSLPPTPALGVGVPKQAHSTLRPHLVTGSDCEGEEGALGRCHGAPANVGRAAGPHTGRPEPSCHCRGALDVSTCDPGIAEGSLTGWKASVRGPPAWDVAAGGSSSSPSPGQGPSAPSTPTPAPRPPPPQGPPL